MNPNDRAMLDQLLAQQAAGEGPFAPAPGGTIADDGGTMGPFIAGLPTENPSDEEYARRLDNLRAAQDATTLGGASHFREGGNVPDFVGGVAKGALGGAAQGVGGVMKLAGLGGLDDNTGIDADALAAHNPYAATLGGVIGGGGAAGGLMRVVQAAVKANPLPRIIGAAAGGATLASTPVGGQTLADSPITLTGQETAADIRRIQQRLNAAGYKLKLDGRLSGTGEAAESATLSAIQDYNSKLERLRADAAHERRFNIEREDRLRAEKKADDARNARAAELAARKATANRAIEEENARRARMSTGETVIDGLKDAAPYLLGLGAAGTLRGAQLAKHAAEGPRNAAVVAGAADRARSGMTNLQAAAKSQAKDTTPATQAALGEMEGAVNTVYSSRNLPSPFAKLENGKAPPSSGDLYKAPGWAADNLPGLIGFGAGAGTTFGLRQKYQGEADAAMREFERTGDRRFLQRARDAEDMAGYYAQMMKAEIAGGLTYGATSKIKVPSPFPAVKARNGADTSQPSRDYSDIMAAESMAKRVGTDMTKARIRSEYDDLVKGAQNASRRKGAADNPPPPIPSWGQYRDEAYKAEGIGSAAASTASSTGATKPFTARDALITAGAGVGGAGVGVGGGAVLKASGLGPQDETPANRGAAARALERSDHMASAIERVLGDEAFRLQDGKLSPKAVTAIVTEMREKTGLAISPARIRGMLKQAGGEF